MDFLIVHDADMVILILLHKKNVLFSDVFRECRNGAFG